MVQGATGFHSTIPVPSAVDQATDYLKKNKVGPEDIYVIMIGANDAFFQLAVDGVIPAISDIIHSLHSAGKL